MKPPLIRGQTSNIAFVFLPDSSSAVGAGKTGLTNASAGLRLSVRREKGATMTAYVGASIVTISTPGTWVNPGSGQVGFKEVDATNAPGLYEVQFEDAIFNSSDSSRVLVGMIFATGTAPAAFEIPLWSVDPQDGERLGLAALPNAAVGTNGGLATLDASLRTLANVGAWNGHAVPAENIGGVPKVDVVDFLGQAVVLDANNLIKVDVADWAAAIVATLPANFGSLAITVGGAVTVAANNDKTGYSLSTAFPTAQQIASQVWQDATSGGDFATTGSVGKLITSNLDANIGSRLASGSVTVGTNNDKTGYSLAATGLDQISVADPGGMLNQTTLPRLIVALWRRFFKKSTLTATQLATYSEDGVSINTTQLVSDDGTTQTQGAGS